MGFTPVPCVSDLNKVSQQMGKGLLGSAGYLEAAGRVRLNQILPA